MALRGLKFYTVKEVAEIMQVRIETVLRWIYSKTIKASKLPGSRVWRIREEDIESFMELGSNMTDNIDESELDDILNNGDVEDISLKSAKPVKEEVKAYEDTKPNVQSVPEVKKTIPRSERRNVLRKDKVSKNEEMNIKSVKEVPDEEFITVGAPVEYKPEDIKCSFTFD